MTRIRIRVAALAATLVATVPMAIAGSAVNASTSGRVASAVAYPWCAGPGNPAYCVAPSGGTPIYNNESIGVGYNTWRIQPTYAGENVHSSSTSCSGDYPFTCGDGCNSRYNGDSIWYLEWANNTNYTMRDYTAQNDQVKISSTFDDRSLWVQSGTWWINVGATNNAGANCTTGQPLILTYRPNTNTVWSSCGNCYDAWKQNWFYSNG